MNYTKILLNIIIPNKKGINGKILNKITEDRYPNIFRYLMSIYTDSASIRETVRRLNLHIDIKPVCPICGKPVTFIGKTAKMFSTYCSNSCRGKDPKNIDNWVNGQRKYNLEHYGVEHNFQREEIKNKRKETLVKHYGTTSLLNVPEIKEKVINTLKQHYGEDAIYIIDKHRQETNLIRFGYTNAMKSNEIKEKRYETLRKNNTWNTSQPEKDTYELLKLYFDDVLPQYKSDKYPFSCDFYITSLDLYIECNYHWTHNTHLFDETNKADIEELTRWKEKNSKYYDKAIQTWTQRDVIKYNTARNNKLRYIVFYEYAEFVEWLTNDKIDLCYAEEVFNAEMYFYKHNSGNLNKKFTNSKIIKYFQQDLLYKKEKELWADINVRAKLVANRIYYLNKPYNELRNDELINGFKLSHIYYGYSHFNPMWFKWFIEQYNVKRCYDPCGGWGHRLLGALNLELYIYNDYSITTYENVNRIIQYFNITNTVTYNNDATYFVPTEEFDAMFTCPPYYNLEHYECGDFDNIEDYYKLIDNIFNCFYNSNATVFGIVIREDCLEDKYKQYAVTQICLSSISNHMHKNNSKKYQEFLYIFNK